MRLVVLAIIVALYGCKSPAQSSSDPAPSASAVAEISPAPSANPVAPSTTEVAVATVDAAPTTSSTKTRSGKMDAGAAQAQLQMLKALGGGTAIQNALGRSDVPINDLSGAPAQPSATSSPRH
jgi:hypothetical protein